MALVVFSQLFHHRDLTDALVVVLVGSFLLLPLALHFLIRVASNPVSRERQLLYVDAICFGFWAAWLNFPTLITVLLILAAVHPLLVDVGMRGLLGGLAVFAVSAAAADGIHSHDLSTIEVVAVEVLAAAALFLLVSKISWDQRQREVELATGQVALQAAVVSAREEAELATRLGLEREQFLNILTHELSQPLGVMKYDLLKASIPPEIHRSLTHSVNDMVEIVDRVLLMGKIEHYGVDLSEAEFDVIELVAQTIGASLQRHRFVLQSEIESLRLKSDQFVVEKILRNLFSNAEKYSPENSDIRVAISAEVEANKPRQLTIEVVNDVGTSGMPDAEKLFTKYYRGPGATKHNGSGLGLVIIQHLAGAIDAAINCNLDEAGKVKFSLSIKIH